MFAWRADRPASRGREIRARGFAKRCLTNPRNRQTAVTRFVEQLLLVTSPLQSIVNHMFEFQAAGRSAPDAPPVEVVLAELLEGLSPP